MVKKNQIIFREGKKEALKNFFTTKFNYLAIGYQKDAGENGFEDEEGKDNGFLELEDSNGYHRVPLQLDANSIEDDPDTGKVLVKFTAELDSSNIQQAQPINQYAIVDDSTVRKAGTKFYSATTFETFEKTQDSTITFEITFRL